MIQSLDNLLMESDVSTKAYEEALAAVANAGQKEPEFSVGQPAWIHGDPTTYIIIGLFRAMWSERYAAAVPEDKLDSQPVNIPCSWLSDLMPGEPRYDNIIRLSDYRRVK